ncbi:MAG TPA: transposase [Longimicrobiales bacterium]|nr:transposase [Longimicrobiales bacterium]
MGRMHRSHLPGVAFHITARAQAREAVLVDLESTIARWIVEHASFADISLLAYAVMPNHLHLVLVQGARPLANFLQPLLRRIALLVMRAKAKEGHIFERRYFDVPCLDANHVRNAISYTHLNGWRGGLCSGAHDFAPCSHALLCSAADRTLSQLPLQLGLESTLRLFALRPDQTLTACRADYLGFVAWRMAMDIYLKGGGSVYDAEAPARPWVVGGDEYWEQQFARHAPARAESRASWPIADLRDIARAAIAEVAPGMDLPLLRGGGNTRAVVSVRRYLIPRALAAGHSRSVLARFLGVAPSTVSASLGRARHSHV